MPYNPTTWTDFPATGTPVTAAELNRMEAGIDAAYAAAIELFDAKGDIIVGSAADTPAKQAVGADDAVLTGASGQSTGVVWQKVNNAMVATNAAIARSKLATETRRVPINLQTPRQSSLAGNAFWTVLGLTDYDAGHWEFVKDVDGKAYGYVQVPAAASTTAGSIILAIAANATTGVSRLQIGTKAVADGESMNPGALTDETAQDITVPGTAYLQKIVTFPLTEALAANDILIVEVFHAGAHANDTVAVNTLLFGAWLEVAVT